MKRIPKLDGEIKPADKGCDVLRDINKKYDSSKGNKKMSNPTIIVCVKKEDLELANEAISFSENQGDIIVEEMSQYGSGMEIDEIESAIYDYDADVIFVDNRYVKELIQRNPKVFMSLNGCFDSNFYSFIFADVEYDNDIYGFPCGSNTVALYYQKDLVDPSRLTTWEDLYEYCCELKEQGEEGVWLMSPRDMKNRSYGNEMSYSTVAEVLLKSMGYKSRDLSVKVEGIETGFEFLSKCLDEGFIRKENIDDEAFLHVINNHQVGPMFIVDGLGWFSRTVEAAQDILWGVTKLPVSKNYSTQVSLGGYSWMVVDRGDREKQEAIVDFLIDAFGSDTENAKGMIDYMADNYKMAPVLQPAIERMDLGETNFSSGEEEINIVRFFGELGKEIEAENQEETVQELSYKLEELMEQLDERTISTAEAISAFWGFMDTPFIEEKEFILSWIEINQKPENYRYLFGETFENAGTKVIAHYNNGFYRQIPLSDCRIICEAYQKDKGFIFCGENIPVTIFYEEGGIEKSISILINIYKRELLRLETVEFSKKNNYIEGEYYETAGIKMKACYAGNIEREIPIENLEFEILEETGTAHDLENALTLNDKKLLILYNEGITEVEQIHPITVKEKKLTDLRIGRFPDKREYSEGERVDLTGIIVRAEYSNSLWEEISLNNIELENNGYLEKGDVGINFSYTYKDITKSKRLTGLRVHARTEANAEINQSQLTYSCGTGQAFVNVASGEAVFEMPITSIGTNDYSIGLNQVYCGDRLELPNHIKTYMPKGWKLNIQQYLFGEGGRYIYVDGSGNRHTFEWLAKNQYYDTSGLGLILTNGEKSVISDQYGNKMRFSDGVLVETESCHDDSSCKLYNYADGKLVSVYDKRTPENKIEFIYDNESGLLRDIKVRQKNAEDRKTYRFSYNFDDNFAKVQESAGVNGSSKSVAIFGYYADGRLFYAADAEDKSAIVFEYDAADAENRVSKIKTGMLPDGFASDAAMSDFKEKSSNLFVYEKKNGKVYRTLVTNEKGLTAVYYLNTNGITTSILETENEATNDLRSLEKRPGISVIATEEGSSGEQINGCKEVALTDGQILEKSFGDDDEINKYRKNKYSACKYFTISFWLKFEKKKSSKAKTEFTVNVNSGTGKTVSFDDLAENAWQLVTVPIEISGETIEKIEFGVTGVNGCKIADMKLLVDQLIQFRIRSDDDSAALEEFSSVKFSRPGAARSTEKLLSDGYYMSEKDLQATYYSMATSKTDTFVLSLCDNTERHVVENACLYHAGKTKEFALDLPSNGKARFYQEIKSSEKENGTTIEGNVYFGKDENGNAYEGICQETRASRDGKSSASYVYLDYKGLLKKERDEYGVETTYEYDVYGRLTKKTISHADTEEKLEYTAEQNETQTREESPTTRVVTTFDELFGNALETEYKGKSETGSGLTTEYTYDAYNERLISVKNDADENPGENTLTYNEKGKLQKVMTTGYNGTSGAYGYAFEYDTFGNVSKSSLVTGTDAGQVLTERISEYSQGETTEKKYREIGKADTTSVQLDKYGRTAAIAEKSYGDASTKTTTFTRQNLSESAGAAEVTEMYDPYENRTYVYGYDDANNCTGYTIKNGNAAGEEFFSIKKTGENKVSYKLNDIYSDCVSEVVYDDNALMSPRVIETSSILVNNSDVNDGEVKYIYDAFGRISQKEHSIYDKLSDVSTIKVTTEYKTGTMLKKTFKTELEDGGDIVNAFDYSYKYTDRGLVSESTCHRKYYLQNPNAVDLEETETRSYMYDKADRLKSEIRPINGINTQTTYYYRPDGGLDREQRGTNAGRTYMYDYGRLKSYRNQNESDKVTFTYDNFGNCTGYSGAGINVTMTWKRGNLLANYTREETGNNVDATYEYNSRGQRCKKSVNGVETTYYYDGGKLIAEKTGDRVIRYMYDAEGLLGMAVWYDDLEKSKDNMVYHFVKDGQGNVIGLMNYYDAEAWYSYDAWGNCKVLNPDGTVNTKAEFIGNINPIRWKSQYYDAESRMYYIGGRYYDPDIKRYVSPGEPEEAIANAGTVYGINPYLLCLTNPVNMVYNGYTIETDGELSYEPDELSNWSYFWKVTWNKFWNSKIGKGLAIGLFVAATVLAIVYPPFAAIYGQALLGVGLSLGVGGLVAGLRSRSQGNGFWDGFVNHISENWSQELAIGMAVALVTFGVSRAVQAMKQVGPHCFIAGTLVACLSADGEEIHKPIEEIEVGDEVLSYDEETGEQGYKPVVRLFRNQTKEWYHVFIDGEEIECTGGHPFYVEGKGFIPAKELQGGDKCLLSTGKDVTIEKVEVEKLAEAETTYNFEVADFHTYYVTEKDVLVHNKCWEWGKGTYKSAEESLRDHAFRHGTELGLDPTDTAGYFKKATNFADTVVQRRIKAGRFIEGATPGIYEYTYLGKYIYMDKYNKIIVSFGIKT